MLWALVASLAIKHYVLSSLPVGAAFIVGCIMDYRHLIQLPVIYMPADPILSGSFFAKIFGVDGPVAKYYPDTDKIWYHFYVQHRLSDPPPRPIAPWSPWFDSDEDVPYYDAPTPGTSMFKDILANRLLPLMPSGVNLILVAGLSLVLISILIGFFVSNASRSVAAQSESVLKDDANEAHLSSIQWPVPLCIVASLVLGRVSVSPGLFEEMRDTVVFISALAVLVAASLKLLHASYITTRPHGPCNTPTGSSSVTDTVCVLSEPLVIEPESTIGKIKANGECKDPAISRPDIINSHVAVPLDPATGSEAATIDMKMLADDKLAPLVTTSLVMRGNTVPESNESSQSDGGEEASTRSSRSLPSSEVLEDAVSHSLPTTNSTSGKSKKKGKKTGSSRKAYGRR